MFKLQFEKNFLMLIKDLKKALKSNIYDRNSSKETLRTPALKYISSLRDREQLFLVEELVKKYDEMSRDKETEWIYALARKIDVM
jgi:hypothetical protein